MNEKLKQRLVGAIVLVSLAVIFIPMLLDGGERSSMPMFGSNIPDKPDYAFEPLDIPLQPVPPIAEERPVLIDKPEPSPEPESRAEAPVDVPKAAEAPKPESKPEPEPEEATPSSEHATAWVVQVGSFSNSENALSLRNKLRSNGFTAFVEKLKKGSSTIYRVRIGPELKRKNAEAALRRLEQKLKLKGIVMGYEA